MRDGLQVAPAYGPALEYGEERPAVHIALLPGRRCLRLKSWLPAGSPDTRGSEFAGSKLPSITRTSTAGELRILCVGPDEWLVVADAADKLEFAAGAWSKSSGAESIALVSLSDAMAGVRVQGRAARQVLSKGCGLDFHPDGFPPGRCARTLFAKIAAVVDCVGPEYFDLYVARSYVAWLQNWLADAVTEFLAEQMS